MTPRRSPGRDPRGQFARSNSCYAQASNQDMLTATLDGLVARFGLAGQRLGEVAAGAVLKHSLEGGTRWNMTLPGCGSSVRS